MFLFVQPISDQFFIPIYGFLFFSTFSGLVQSSSFVLLLVYLLPISLLPPPKAFFCHVKASNIVMLLLSVITCIFHCYVVSYISFLLLYCHVLIIISILPPSPTINKFISRIWSQKAASGTKNIYSFPLPSSKT